MTIPSVPLGGRYLYKAMIEAGTRAPTWLVSDLATGKEAVAASLDPVRAGALREAVGLEQDHLAAIIAVVDNPDPASMPGGAPAVASVVVAEHVGGRTLHETSTAALTSTEAVALLIPLGRAVAALHARGGVHGAISPRSVVIVPTDGRPGPVLTQLCAQTRGPYCAPERLQGRGLSAADDTWALHALLFALLTGKPPFRGQTKDDLLRSMASGQRETLGDFGVHDAELEAVIEAGLIANLARRRSNVAALVEALERWEPPAHAAAREAEPAAPTSERGPNPFDDEEDATMIMRQPASAARSFLTSPSEPPAAAVAPAVEQPVHEEAASAAEHLAPAPPAPVPVGVEPRRPRTKPVWLLFGALVVVGVGVAGGLTLRRTTAAGPPPTGSKIASSAQAPAASVLAVTSAEPRASASAAIRAPRQAPMTPEQRSRCVAAHFEAGTFDGVEDMGFLCDASDFRGINSLLYRRLVVAGAGKITPGMREWSTFGWFELAATAVVRAGCCPASTAPPSLPRTPGDCPQLSAALGELSEQLIAKEGASARAATYEEAVMCLYKNGIPRPYNYQARPTRHGRRAFEAFFVRKAALDGR